MGSGRMKKNCGDVATNTREENEEETTKFRKTCRKFGINPDLIMLKVTLFVMYGATASLLPYLTIHMRSVGLTLKEISFVYLALPFTTFLSPPITGFLVDKFGQYKPVVVIALLLNAAFHHALYLLPSQEVKGVFPDAYVIRHPVTEKTEIWWSPCPSRECPAEEEIDLVLDRCIDHCLLREHENFVTSTEKVLIDPGDKDDLNLHISKARKNPNILKSNRSALHTRDPLIQELEKNISKYDNDKLRNMADVNITDNMEEPYSDAAFFLVDMHPDLEGAPESLGMELEPEINETAIDFKRNFGEKLLHKYGVNITELDQLDLRCGGIVMESNKTEFAAKLKLSEWAADCLVQKCRFRHGGPEQCPPDYLECDDMTFWIYFVLRFFGSIMLSAGVTIMDPIALQMIEQYGGDYGREKLFSSIGMAIFSPITGVLIDVATRQMGYADYSAAFYTYDILLTVSTVTVLMMPLGAKLPADNIFTDLMNLLQMPHVIMFIIFLFCLGNFWGFIESFLFLYLTELGAPNYLLGITVTVGTVSSMPFLYGAEAITAKVGHVYVIVIAFLSHAARLVGYSFIENPWWCFPFEALESLSVHLMWVAAATYCAMLAPKSLLATLIGVLGMSHFSLGRGSGSFGGGLMIEQVGIREAFRYMGLIALILGIIYFILHFFWLRHYEDVAVEAIEPEDVETGESAKLNREPPTKEVSTMVSVERLHMMIDYNPLGSLTSLPRGSRVRLSQGDINELYRSRSNSTRRSSNVEISNKTTPRGSASKVDLLKSALEINHHNQNQQNHPHHPRNNISNPALSRNGERTSHHKLTNSAPKLNQKNMSQSLLPLVDHERIISRRDSIPEEIEEERILQITAPAKVGHRTRGPNASALAAAREHTPKDNEHRKSWHHEDNNPT